MTNVYHVNRVMDSAMEFVSKLIQSNANDSILYFFRCVFLHIFLFLCVLFNLIRFKRAIFYLYPKTTLNNKSPILFKNNNK